MFGKQGITMLNKIENTKSSRLCVSLKKIGAGRKCLLGCWGIFLFVTIICDVTHAGVIKIRTQTTLKTSEQNLEISVTLFNDGSDSARNLQVHAKLPGKTIDSKMLPELGPGKSRTFLFDEKMEGAKPGWYPITIVTDFQDANQYPFSAISGMTFSLGSGKTAELAILGKDSRIEKKGKLSFNVKNIGERKKQIQATLVLPRELSSPASEQNFELPARDEKSLAFEIQNFSALSGADYPVFCYFEYDQDGIHHTAVSNATIRLITEENLFRRYRWVWMILIAVLLAAFVVIMVRQKKRR